MNDEEVLKLLKEYVKGQGEDFRFVMGRNVYGKKELLRLLDRDKKFRKMMVEMVAKLSIDILLRGVKSED